MTGLALNNGKAFIDGRLVKANILVEEGRIARISSGAITAEKEIDCSRKIVLPGAIDCHVHFRSPGFEQKESMVSGSLAAIHGGITTVMDMPNTSPKTVTLRDWEDKKALASRDCAVAFDAYMGMTGDNLGEIRMAAEKGLRAVKVYFGSSTGSMLFGDAGKLMELFLLSREKGFVVAVHAEDDAEISRNAEKFRGRKDAAVHAKIRTGEAEAKAISALTGLQEKAGNKLHIAHISSKDGLALVKKARKGRHGSAITCEVTPHHLFLDSRGYKKSGNLMKCNPSIKSPADREALWRGLKAGDIDIVATDHAPHTPEEKARGYWDCPSGIPGVETMMPLLLDSVARGKIPLGRVVEACCEKPAEIFGWKAKGFIREGLDADIIVVDMEKTWKVDNEKLFTRAGYSPFNGRKLKGFVENTIAGGQVFG
ncbi:MAG: dihydroorotase family protein [Candidatus Diapherotrites archaeon]|uniref:Dihydroorotase n=1 Tax=Candidatus Iainarchaeum sp. TaxID=3101447 RepID=A0A8T3YMT5_9ARCH|nr:dihydroorotase family protein [Candidatus Diapherotrites archaeon]